MKGFCFPKRISYIPTREKVGIHKNGKGKPHETIG